MVKPMMNRISETSIRMMPQSCAARRAGQDRLRRIERPAGAGRPAGREEARHQHQHGEQIDPVAQHVDIGEHHVARADHQRDQVVAEAAEEQRGQQIDHHDHAVHGDELVIGLGRDEGEGAGEAELQPHQPGQHQRHQADADRGAAILDGDDLGVLREDVFRPPAMRMVEFDFLELRPAGWRRPRRGVTSTITITSSLFRREPAASRACVTCIVSPMRRRPRSRWIDSAAPTSAAGADSCAKVCCSPQPGLVVLPRCRPRPCRA